LSAYIPDRVYTSIKVALARVKLLECVGREAATSAADLLSKPSTWISRAPAGRISQGPSEGPSGLGVVVGTLPTGSVASCTPPALGVGCRS
jgi:hypothetical protein